MSLVATIWEANTWAEFLTAIREVKSAFKGPKQSWFRGHSKRSYSLIPSLFRVPQGLQKEQIIFDEYERSAAYLMNMKRDHWEMLEDMQHYGIPTRLLDWTDVLGVAVAFSLYDANDLDDSVIYVLDPVRLNDRSGLSGIKRASADTSFDYKNVYWQGKPFFPNYPIAIDGRLHNERLRAQSGYFTVHGRSDAPLDEQAPDVVCKVVICASAKPEAREFLEYANLNPFRIYPDMVGMARHIVRKRLVV